MSSKELTTQLQNAAEVYNQNTSLRALISAIPYIGSSIDVIITSRAQIIIQQRLNFFLEQLKKDVRTLKESSIDRDYIESEEFFDLLIKTIEYAVKTRHREKITIYSRVLRNSLVATFRQGNDPEEFLLVLVELSPIEIEILKAIYDHEISRSAETEIDGEFWGKYKGIDKILEKYGAGFTDPTFYLKRIERTGLIAEIVGMILGYEGGAYEITEGLMKMMKFIQAEE